LRVPTRTRTLLIHDSFLSFRGQLLAGLAI
jgi:hypothetical protein